MVATTHARITLGRPRRSARLPGLRLFEVAYEPGRAMAPHAHAHANVSIVLEGGFLETCGDRTERAGAGSVVVKPRGTIHSNRFDARPTRSLIIEIDPRRERDLVDGRNGLGPARWLHAGRVAHAALDVYRAFVEERDDLEHRLVNALRASIFERGPVTAGGIVTRAEQILRQAERPPTVASLARDVGVHPVHLARLFRAAHGCGVAAYRRRLQVFHAARRLACPTTPLAWIAADCGFADQSHMCRAFREEFGLTPGTFRILLRG